jgi:phenylalanyl-tRNA synthetase alpha chain
VSRLKALANIMRLMATGLCVRAARSTRLTGAAPVRPLLKPVTSARRFNSIQAAPRSSEAAFPEQSVSPSEEINPGKTARAAEAPAAAKDVERQENSRSLTDKQPFQSQSLGSAPTATSGSKDKTTSIDGRLYSLDETSNLSTAVTSLVGRRLYDAPDHPICITRKLIERVFPSPSFVNHVAYNPVATIEQNFGALGFPEDHPGRSRTDTYYVNSQNVLRTHTSAHQLQAFQHLATRRLDGYTICADVYRRDSIDKSHFPVFHQMEGARCWGLKRNPNGRDLIHRLFKRRIQRIVDDYKAMPKAGVEVVEGQQTEHGTSFDLETNPPQAAHALEEVRVLVLHLKKSLEHLFSVVFDEAKKAGLGDEAFKEGDKLKVRWVEAYFPFTSPSFELEIFWQGEWMEMLGCGIVQQKILDKAGLSESVGWAWGIGVERLAMLLFGVPDIRLFWSEDPRFLSQFKEGQITKFVPFSKYPACYKDVAFWIDAAPAAAVGTGSGGVAAAAGGDAKKASPAETQPAAFHENDVMEIVRDIAGSLAEDVQVVDEFVHPTSGRKSLCYRINYRSLERTLTNEEVNEMHQMVVDRIGAELRVELR